MCLLSLWPIKSKGPMSFVSSLQLMRCYIMPKYKRVLLKWRWCTYIESITDIGVLLVPPGECMWIMFKHPMVCVQIKISGIACPLGFGHWVPLIRPQWGIRNRLSGPQWLIGFIKPEHRVLRVSSILSCFTHMCVPCCCSNVCLQYSISLSKLVLSVDALADC